MSVFSDAASDARKEYLRQIAHAVVASWESELDDDSCIEQPSGIDDEDWFWILGYARCLQDKKAG